MNILCAMVRTRGCWIRLTHATLVLCIFSNGPVLIQITGVNFTLYDHKQLLNLALLSSNQRYLLGWEFRNKENNKQSQGLEPRSLKPLEIAVQDRLTTKKSFVHSSGILACEKNNRGVDKKSKYLK